MQRQAYLCFIDLVVLFYPSLVQCSSSGDYKVLVWSNGPAIVGETTSFNAEAVLKPETRTRYDKNGNVTYEFSWKVPSQPWIKHQKTTKRSDSFRWRWTTEAGFKTVSVYVRILKNYNGRDSTHGRSFSSYYATNRTEVEVSGSEDIIIATLDAYQNSTLETRQGNDEDKSFNVGAVTLKLTIHNFPHQDLSGVLYDWNLGDGTQLLDYNLKQVTHNFTTVKSCKVVVNLHGQIQGKYYNGTASKTLKFTVNIHPYLVVKSFSGPKLPSDLKYALPVDSPVEFEVKFKDPFKLVASVSTDWKFGDDTTVTNWKNTTIHHTFHKEGKYSLWVTIRVNTKSLGKKSFSIVRNLYVKDIIIATLDAYQNSTLETRQGNDEDKSFNVGAVTLKLTIHNFPHQDLSGILYDWNLGDGTQLLDSNLKQVTHNFTTVKSCKVVVNLHGQIQGKYYNGTASKTLKFTVNIHPYLVVKSFAGPKLPSDLKYALPMDSPVEFEVKFKDPFKLVASVSTDWKFGNDTNVTNWKNTTIHHTFHKEGKYSLWVTIRVNTKSLGNRSFSIVRNLYMKAPVSLEVTHKHLEHKDKTVRFNMSCNGSLPVSFHWCISKQCYLPPGETCMPTMEHSNSCSLIVNHRFSDAGKYCVNVGVMNDVSGTNTSLMVRIPGDIPDPKHNSAKASITGTVVALCIICTLLIGIIIVAAQRWISSKREKTEKADFEFRDDDALSVSSVELFSNKVCFRKFRVWGSRRTAEEVPLCRDTRMYTL